MISTKRFRFAPRVELLESRTQPGSILPILAPGDVSSTVTPPESSGLESMDTTLLLSRSQQHNQELDTFSVPVAMTGTQSSGGAAQAGGSSAITARSADDLMMHNGTPVAPYAGSQTASQTMHAATAVSIAAASQTSAQGGKHAVPATAVRAPAMTVQNVAGLTHQANVQLTPLKLSQTVGAPPAFILSTALGAAGEAGLNGVARDGSGNLYVSGYADLTASGKIIGLVAKTNSSGAILWMTGVTEMNPAPDKMYGVALNAAGTTVFAVGALDNGTGTTDGVVVALDAGTGMGVAATLPSAVFTGVTLDGPGNVYLDGYDTSGTGAVLAFKLDPTLSMQFYGVGITAGAPIITTSSQSIAVDSGGDAALTGQLQNPGDNDAFYLSLSPSGGFINWAFLFMNETIINGVLPPTPAPGLFGTANGIIWSGDHFYFTGTNSDAGGGTALQQDLLLVKVDPLTGDPGQPGNYAWVWFVDDRTLTAVRVGDWTGTGIALTGALSNQAVVTGGAIDSVQYPPTDPPTQGEDVCVTHFGATGATTTLHPDGDPENCFGGSNADYGNGLVVNAGIAYTIGITASPDFPVTATGTPYGGGPTDGFGSIFPIV